MEGTIAAVVALAVSVGSDPSRYAYDWEEALVVYAGTDDFADGVPSRAGKKPRGQVRRGHLMRCLTRLYRAFVFDPASPTFWASNELIAEKLVMSPRRAREIIAAARLAGVLVVQRRWDRWSHDPGR